MVSLNKLWFNIILYFFTAQNSAPQQVEKTEDTEMSLLDDEEMSTLKYNVDEEIASYMAISSSNQDPLNFWRQFGDRFPNISIVARNILCKFYTVLILSQMH